VSPSLDFRFLKSRVGIERVLAARGLLATMRQRGAHERNQTFIDDHTMEAAIDSSLQAQTVTA
jgi:hypothetical protein